MALTRKHFRAIATALESNLPRDASPQTRRYARNVARDVADFLETQNPRFDREKFLEASGFYEETS